MRRKVFYMTDKELTYVEDALNHVKHFHCLCDESSHAIQDPALRAFVQEVQSEVQCIYNSLFTTLSK